MRTVGGETRRETKSLRNGVHHANAVVWGPVYNRTRLISSVVSPFPSLRPPGGPITALALARLSAASFAASFADRVSIPPHPPRCPSFAPGASNPTPVPPTPLAVRSSHSAVISSRS